MLSFLETGKISHFIGGREGGTGAQRSLHVRIPLNPTIPAVLFACQSDHASRSYANVYRLRQNQLLHWREGGRQRSTTFFTHTDSSRSHDSSSAVRLLIGQHVAELYQFLIQRGISGYKEWEPVSEFFMHAMLLRKISQ